MMKNTHQNKKIILGFSGGVDSTVAALLLKEQGYNVVGYYFNGIRGNYSEKNNAKKVANELNIELICDEVCDEFEKKIISNFISEYKNGRTPNPCVICNPEIKFKKLLETAKKEGANFIATGHYAKVEEHNGNFFICKGANEKKDQSYMLYRLGQDVLSKLVLPLGNIEDKEIVRKFAQEKNTSNSNKKDSQEICFVPENISYIDFLEEKGVLGKNGDFIDTDGKKLGTHKGIICYTKGQRKGLGIALGKPVFVTHIDPKNNTITLGDSEDLMEKKATITDIFITANQENSHGFDKYLNVNLKGKSRYAAVPSDCKIIESDNTQAKIEFKEPQRSLTPGQSIVLYEGDKVIGGGFIK